MNKSHLSTIKMQQSSLRHHLCCCYTGWTYVTLTVGDGAVGTAAAPVMGTEAPVINVGSKHAMATAVAAMAWQ